MTEWYNHHVAMATREIFRRVLLLLISSMSITVVCQICLLYRRSANVHNNANRQLLAQIRRSQQTSELARGDSLQHSSSTRPSIQAREEIKPERRIPKENSNSSASPPRHGFPPGGVDGRHKKSEIELLHSREYIRKHADEVARVFYAKYAEKLENGDIDVEVYSMKSKSERISAYANAFKKYNITSKKGTVVVKNKKGDTKVLVTSPPVIPTTELTTLPPPEDLDAGVGQIGAGYHKKVGGHKKIWRKRKRVMVSENTEVGILNKTQWKSHTDMHEYSYILNPVDKCLTDTGTFKRVSLLIFVASAPKNFERREAIRRTWGMARVSATRHVETVFLVGAVDDDDTQKDLNRELISYGDIVQESFVDSYLNLTIKTVAGFKWASKYCQNAKFVMKTDDDMMVNTVRMLLYLRTAPWKNFIAGKAVFDFDVIRDPHSKFYVPYRVLRQDKYPPYLIGIGYVMSIDVVNKVYITALQIPLFPWEDVFVGMCLHRMGIVPKVINGFMGGGFFDDANGVLKKDTTSMSRLRSTFVIHDIPIKYMDLVWAHWAGLG